MKRTFSFLLFAFTFLAAAEASATTWFVRPDGGSRYSVNMTQGQCDGTTDAAYPGSGTNQHCAFKDIRYFWQDGSYATGQSFPGWGWVGAGGDTYLVRGSLATNVSYRIGWNNPSNAWDTPTGQFWGLAGDPYASGIPAPPSGTATAHTRFLGENYASCSAGSAKTQLHGGYGLYTVLNMGASSYVDVACFDITDYSNCSLMGGATTTCNKSFGSISDYAKDGISWNNQSTHDTLTNIHIHGLAADGMRGPTGDGMVFQNLDILGNSASGWDADAGDGSNGIGSLLVQNYNISWNGCTEEYPVVDALPYSQCSDDNSGGYGDGFGTATVATVPQGWQVHFDQGIVSYNTQDGLDALHLTGANSSMTITRTQAFGNMGQQIKIGGAKGVAQNNIITSNCNALRGAIPGTPAGYNAHLGDFCRAADTAVLVTVGKGSTTSFDNNTIYSASATGVEVECDGTNGPCDRSSLIDFRNNIFVGFLNIPANGYTGSYATGTGDYSNPLYDGTGLWPFTSPGSKFSNNIVYHYKSNFNCASMSANMQCVDPLLTDETWHNYGSANMLPLSSSPAIGAGATITSVLEDFAGITRSVVPTIGAMEFVKAVPPTAIPTTPAVPTKPGSTQVILTLSKGSSPQFPLVLTATVTAASGTSIPSGTVVLYSGSQRAIGKAKTSANGSVSWPLPANLINTTIYGTFVGTSSFGASTSSLLKL